MVVADKAVRLQLSISRLAGLFIGEQTNLPELFAKKLIMRVAQQVRHEGVGVDDFQGLGIENENVVFGYLEQPPIPDSRVIRSRFRQLVVGHVLNGEQDQLWVAG